MCIYVSVYLAEIRVPANSDGMTSLVFCRQSLRSSAISSATAAAALLTAPVNRLFRSVGIGPQIVQLALRARCGAQRRHRFARCTLLDVEGQIQKGPGRIILEVAEILGSDRPNRIEGIVIGLRRVDLAAHGRGIRKRIREVRGMGESVDVVGDRKPQQFQQRGDQIDPAEQVVVHPARCRVSRRWPHDHRDAGARVVQRGLRPRQGRAVVGHEHHPGRAVESGLGQGVEQLPDRGVGHRDRAVEVGQVLAHVGQVGQVVGQADRVGIGRLVPFPRIGPVRLEEARGQQERSRRRLAQPAGGPLDHVLAVRVRHVVLIEPEPRRKRGLVLHAEQRCMPT